MAAPTQEKSPLIAFTLDFETGGLKCQTSACTQIAVHATRLDTFEHVASIVRYIRPYAKKEIKALAGTKRKVLKRKYDNDTEELMDYEDAALSYSAITMDMLYQQGQDIESVANDVLKFMQDHTPKCGKNSKPFLVGQNIGFDEGFFCQMMEYAGLMGAVSKILRGHTDFYGHWHPLTLDTILLGQLALCHQPDVTSYKLEIMCERLGIELDDAHDADADVAATTGVVAVLARRMRQESTDSVFETAKAEKTRKHFKI